MNKLRLLRRLHDDELFCFLSGKELRLFLLMIADSTESGEGKMYLGQITSLFDNKISQKELESICEELQKKQFVRLTSIPGCGSSVMYQIRNPDDYAP